MSKWKIEENNYLKIEDFLDILKDRKIDFEKPYLYCGYDCNIGDFNRSNLMQIVKFLVEKINTNEVEFFGIKDKLSQIFKEDKIKYGDKFGLVVIIKNTVILKTRAIYSFGYSSVQYFIDNLISVFGQDLNEKEIILWKNDVNKLLDKSFSWNNYDSGVGYVKLKKIKI